MLRAVFITASIGVNLAFGATQTQCPPPLTVSHFATHCTGKSVELKGVHYEDCSTADSPTHPMHPEALRLVEHVRCKVGDLVKITSGYRSPRHNDYSWAFVVLTTGDEKMVARDSKHTRGNAVDFYVTGFSYEQHEAIAIELHAKAGKLPKTLRGSNERIWTKVYRPDEGRDPDNQHSNPYIHLELREAL